MAGGVLSFTFWIFPALELQGLDIWPVALAIHGAQIFSVGLGLALVPSRLDLEGPVKTVAMTGIVMAILGSGTSLGVFAAGLIILAIVIAQAPRVRLPAALLISGGVLWLALVLGGGVIGNEDAPALDALQRVLAIAGLTLIAAGLVTLGGMVLGTSAQDLVHRGVIVPEDDGVTHPGVQVGSS